MSRALLQKRPVMMRSLLTMSQSGDECFDQTEKNIVSFIGLFCKRDLSF